MSKDYKRKWLKERHQHEYWKKKYKELEATIKGEAEPLKMSAVTEEEKQIHEFRSTIIANLVAERDALKKELEACQEACKLKDEEIESLKNGLALCLKSKPLEAGDRQVADPEAAKELEEGGEPDDGLSGGVEESKDEEEEEEEQEEEPEAPKEEEEQEEEGAESKEDTSDGTSSGTSDDEEQQESYIEKLRF